MMFNGNLSTWNTGAVTSMHGMFSSEGLTLRAGFNNPSIANWNTSNVRNMRLMFGGYRQVIADGHLRHSIKKSRIGIGILAR